MKIKLVMILCVLGLLSGCAASNNTQKVDESSTEVTLQAYTRLGVQYLQAGDNVNAKSSLQRALAIDDNYAPAHNALALVFQSEREFELAEQYFRKALAIKPMSAMFHNNFGAFLFSRGRFEEACQAFSRATEDPFYASRPQAFENMGHCYQKLGRIDVAEHALRRSLDLQRDRPYAQVALADLLLDKGETAEAANWFNRFREQVEAKLVEHNANSLWVGIRVARADRNAGLAASYGLLLRNLFPNSEEYRLFKESAL